jgi:hypothetical protein
VWYCHLLLLLLLLLWWLLLLLHRMLRWRSCPWLRLGLHWLLLRGCTSPIVCLLLRHLDLSQECFIPSMVPSSKTCKTG